MIWIGIHAPNNGIVILLAQGQMQRTNKHYKGRINGCCFGASEASLTFFLVEVEIAIASFTVVASSVIDVP